MLLQVAFADLVLLNKVDLVPDEKELAKVESRIKAINSNVPITRCKHSEVDWQSIIGVGAFDLNRVLEFEPEFLTDLDAEHEHDERTSSVSVKFDGELMHAQLEEWIGELMQTKGADLFRYKGVLAVKSMDSKFVFQGVGMLFAGGFSNIQWGKDEKRECRFDFIGRDLDKKALAAGVEACKVPELLRFDIGSRVLARPDIECPEWSVGRVVMQWDEGHPYVIELEDEEKTKVYCPLDDDRLIRAPETQGGEPQAKKTKI